LSNTSGPTPAPTLSVSQLNRQARTLLESHFDYIWVAGEISNLARPGSGHWYFTLKDDAAQVRCAMFRNRNQRCRVAVDNGDAVRMRCRVSLYEGRGEFQLIVEHLEAAGAGNLQQAFEALKKKLQTEGLFDSAHKQALPARVSRLGVITSPSGAAIHDILTVLRRRFPGIVVALLPVAVQGTTAAAEIAAAIARANRWQKEQRYRFDALIVGRGGGSLEDLWAFNEELVARAIHASDIPVVSAVGHEVDFTISDLVADYRAATPSAAAELLSPDRLDLVQQLRALESRLGYLTRRRLADLGRDLLMLRRQLPHPGHRLREQSQRLDDLEQRLRHAQRNQLRHHSHRLAVLGMRLLGQSPGTRVQQLQSRFQQNVTRLAIAMRTRLADARARSSHTAQLLDSLSPLRTLERGYAIVSDSAGHVLVDSADTRQGAQVTARLGRGRLLCTVDEVEPEPATSAGQGE
jgi:exodeoxyribonuclease VII large subunit